MVFFSTGFERRGEHAVKIDHSRKIKVFQISTSEGCDSPVGKSIAVQKHGIILCKPKMQAVHHPPHPLGPLLKFAFVHDCGEWWISGYCFTFLSESFGLSPSTRESRGSWQGFFGSSRMWIREKASHFFLEERKNYLVQWKQGTGGIRWALSCC